MQEQEKAEENLLELNQKLSKQVKIRNFFYQEVDFG
jgi:hypothetical protein